MRHHLIAGWGRDLIYRLPAGRFRLEVWIDDGLRRELKFSVPTSLDDVTERLEVRPN